jgi:prepilin-type N-terminal cleavage/methylation domain-containing protein
MAFPGSVTISSLGTVFYLSTAVASRIMPGPEIPLVLYFAQGTALPTVASDLERDFLERRRTMPENQRRGFTMIETLMVLTVMAIVAATAGPKLSAALHRRTSSSAADQFVVTHSLARATALRYGRVAQLHIDAGTRRFWVDVDTSANGIGQRATIANVRDVTGSGLVMTSTRTVLCFDSRGMAATSGSCEPGDVRVVFSDGATADTVSTTLLGKVLR